MQTLKQTLKLTLLATALIAMSASAFLLGTGQAKAAPSGFCHGYAAAAVKQNNRNFIKGCGYSGWRWHGWYQGHYNWCRSTSKAMARSERINRFVMLKQCW